MGRKHYDHLRQCGQGSSYSRVYNIYFNKPITVPPPSAISRDVESSSASPISTICFDKLDTRDTPGSLSPSTMLTIDEKECEEKIFKPQDAAPTAPSSSPSKPLQNKNRLSNLTKESCQDSYYRSNSRGTHGSIGKDDHDKKPESSDDLLDDFDSDLWLNQDRKPVDSEVAKDEFVTKVNKRLFWSTKAAKNIKIIKIEHKHAYIYTLESFSEKRQIQWAYEPLKKGSKGYSTGQTIFANGQSVPSASEVWAVETFDKPKLFTSSVQTKEFPNSSFVTMCHICEGRASNKCENCHAHGYETCFSCLGSGHERNSISYNSETPTLNGCNSKYASSKYRSVENASSQSNTVSTKKLSYDSESKEKCHQCHGGGTRRCLKCHGSGFIRCMGCDGGRRVRCFLKLTAIWTRHRQDKISSNVDETIISEDRLRAVTGYKVFERTATKLRPIKFTGDPGLAEISKSLIDKHEQKHQDELIIRQRHNVFCVDADIVRYEWKNKHGHFVIYGDERKCYVSKFRYKTCCTIS